MPIHKKNLYELTAYPLILKKRGNPWSIARVSEAALMSRCRSTYSDQEFGQSANGSRRERQVCDVECRPEAQANVITYATSASAFHGVAERAAQQQSDEQRRGGDPAAGDDQRRGGRHP